MNVLYVAILPWHQKSSTDILRYQAMCRVVDKCDFVKYPSLHGFISRVRHYLFNKGLPIQSYYAKEADNELLSKVEENTYDVIWIDKVWALNPNVLKQIRRISPKTKIVSYTADNMALRHNQSLFFLKSIPLYDLHVTTKSYILDDMKKLGAKDIMFTLQTFAPELHKPMTLTKEEQEYLGAEVGFIGAWEKERCNSLCYLADNGIKVKIFGGGKWAEYANYSKNMTIVNKMLTDESYPKAFSTFKISPCFLRKMNFDQQTSRSVEIPASGGFMLAERTKEHQALFEEGKEAEFFSSDEELLQKCKYYLKHEEERIRIKEQGTKRCHTSGYTNDEMIKRVLNYLVR
ncbi:MAG: glycosyltransferase [Bacteroidales bacterium]|nr:glycosyltransferase [Bacteroidales bacterium]